MMKLEYFFKYLLIPVEVLINKNLNHTDMIVFALISYLDQENHCYASNKYLSVVLGRCIKSISSSISKLVKYEYILSEISKNNRIRIIKVNSLYHDKYRPFLGKIKELAGNSLYNLQENEAQELQEKTINPGFHSAQELQEKTINPGFQLIEKKKENNNNRTIFYFRSGKERSKIKDCRENSEQFSHSSSSKINLRTEEQKKIPINVILFPLQQQETLKVNSLIIKRQLLKTIHKPIVTIKKPIKKVNIPPDVQEILDLWQECKLHTYKKNLNECSGYWQGIKYIKKLFNGTLFKEKYTKEQVRLAILRFALTAFDDKYEPENKLKKKERQKLPLSSFIFNSNSKSNFVGYFSIYVKEDPKIVSKLIENNFERATKQIKDFYEKEFLGGIKPKYSVKDENCFSTACIRLEKFYNENLSRLDDYFFNNPIKRVEVFCEAIKNSVDNSIQVTPSWFSTDYTFNVRFPQYLKKENLWKNER